MTNVTKDGRVDPKHVDVVPRPRQRRRKRRNVPEPRSELKAAKPGLEKRLHARPIPPGVMLEPAGSDEERWSAPHSDFDLWQMQLGECFATRSMSVLQTFMTQLERLCDRHIWDESAGQWRIDEHEFSAMLAMVNSIKPKNEFDAAHAAQMVAVHLMTMKLSARALKYDGDTRTAAVAGKLARTFNDQIRLRSQLSGRQRSSRQNIKVSKETHHHQHIHVHRDDGENDGKPHETDGGELRSISAGRAGTSPECPALPGPCEELGEVLSFPSGERAEDLPHPRRNKPRGAAR